jgi:hypothetical protein
MALILFALLAAAGCQGEIAQPFPRTIADAQLFGPVSMRLHPIFTQVKNLGATGEAPDGVEALVELQDQFGDPTKASGRIIFELFEYQSFDPERRGTRLAVWNDAMLETRDDQRDRWNRTSRTYGFQLAYARIDPRQNYVLTAEFLLSGGGRFFDQIILEGKGRDGGGADTFPAVPALPNVGPNVGPSTGPVNEPGVRTPEP